MKVFSGTVNKIVDGDTVHLAVRLLKLGMFKKNRDLGFSVYIEDKWLVLHYTFRLLGCNAAEHDTEAGAAAKAFLTGFLPVGTVVKISSVKNDKYSRYDASLELPDGRDLVTYLISQQWAAPWDGNGPKPLPPWPRTV